MCHFCKNNGNTIQQCPIRAEVTCFRCNGKGHYQSHCPVSQKDVDFPPLGSGSTPRHTGSTPHIPGSRTRHSGSTPHIPGSTPPVAKSSSYEDAVKRFADNFILTIKRMCKSDKWFVIYPQDMIFEDPFLQKVHSIIVIECISDEMRLEESQLMYWLNAENRDWIQEQKAKKKLAELVASMSSKELEEFENRSSDEDSEEESYYLYERRLDFMDSLETQKQKVEELLNHMVKKQVQRSFEKYEQGRMLRSSDERPRHTLWSAIQEKM